MHVSFRNDYLSKLFNAHTHKGTVYKGRPPEGGRGGFKIVDENGHGGGGF